MSELVAKDVQDKDEEIDRLKTSMEWISLSEKMMDEGEF